MTDKWAFEGHIDRECLENPSYTLHRVMKPIMASLREEASKHAKPSQYRLVVMLQADHQLADVAESVSRALN